MVISSGLRFAGDPTRHCARSLVAACGDFRRFPPFSGEVTHEGVIGKMVF
jgi:hypothetical protein